MSKIIKTVDYEIEPNGDCTLCESMHYPVCCAFSQTASGLYPVGSLKRYIIDQCQECRSYLAEQKSKVKCSGCKYKTIVIGMFGGESGCKLGNKIETTVFDGSYSLDCQDREE